MWDIQITLKEEFHFITIAKVQKQQEVLSGNCYTKKSFIKDLRQCLMSIRLKKTDYLERKLLIYQKNFNQYF